MRRAEFLPASWKKPHGSGRGGFDVVIVTGDAYVDHPSFGAAVIARVLEAAGFRVAVIAQPAWDGPEAFRAFGKPRLFFGITSGAVDTALNLRYSLGARRGKDVYSPSGATGLRPQNPLVTYTALARQAFPGVPVILGGLEASLKRLVYHDSVSGVLKRPALVDAKADLLVFGMGERQAVEIARRLAAGEECRSITDVPGTSYRLLSGVARPEGAAVLPSFSEQKQDPAKAMEACVLYFRLGIARGMPVTQECDPFAVAVLPQGPAETQAGLDGIYSLPFTRAAHPMYGSEKIPALEPVRFSITTHRGCFGGCSFCSLYAHQGKAVRSRSAGSILSEAESFASFPGFTGSIPDVGGPTANMYGVACGADAPCERQSCLWPKPCPNLTGPEPMMKMLEALLKLGRIKCRIASGVRHDLAMIQDGYVDLLAGSFTGGQLKVAPEHNSPAVLELMRKPPFEQFERFREIFRKASARAGKEQYLVPYFVSGHPGCGMDDAVGLYRYLSAMNWKVRQVQDFSPIPLTLSAAMHASFRDPSGGRIHVPGREERLDQLALLRFHMKESEARVRRILAGTKKDKIVP